MYEVLQYPQRYPADTKTSQRRRRNVLILVWKSRRPFFKTSIRRLPGDVLKTSSRRRPQDVFQKTSSRHLPEDVLKTSSKRRAHDVFQETSSRPLPADILKTLRNLKTSRLFLVRAKDHQETIYGLSIYVVLNYLQITTLSLDKLTELI